MAKMVDAQCIERLKAVAATPFKRITYTEAVDILKEVIASKKKKFEFKVRSSFAPARQFALIKGGPLHQNPLRHHSTLMIVSVLLIKCLPVQSSSVNAASVGWFHTNKC